MGDDMPIDKDWDVLYKYVKTEILQYHDKKMPKEMTLRLVGLKDGKFYANKKTKKEGTYDYKLILLTFKLMKETILNALRNTQIKDEQHKVNLIIKIVENEINNVKDRLEAKKKSEEKMESIELPHQTHEQSNYSKKSKEVNEKLKNLW
jgi:hypothetical protein